MNDRRISVTCSRRAFLGTVAFATTSRPPVAATSIRSIATSSPILQDIVANIAGDTMDVFSVLPANADPHTWEPSPSAMVQLSEADGLIYFDEHLEPFVSKGGWAEMLQANGIPTLQVTDHVQLLEFDEDNAQDDHHGHTGDGDPHIWLDPLTIVQAIPAMVTYLAAIDPVNATNYATNGERYTAELNRLHTELIRSFEVIPTERRKLLVFHDAWGYFAARYDFEIVGVVLESPDGEVSARDIVRLLEIIREHDIQAVFVEPQFNTTILDVLADEGGIRIATLLTDSFTPDVTTYIDLMLFNRDQLVSTLTA